MTQGARAPDQGVRTSGYTWGPSSAQVPIWLSVDRPSYPRHRACGNFHMCVWIIYIPCWSPDRWMHLRIQMDLRVFTCAMLQPNMV